MVRRHPGASIDMLNDCVLRLLIADVLWHDLGTVVAPRRSQRESQDTGDRLSLAAGQHDRKYSSFFSDLLFDACQTACSML